VGSHEAFSGKDKLEERKKGGRELSSLGCALRIMVLREKKRVGPVSRGSETPKGTRHRGS